MKFVGITKRWFLNVALIVIAIVISVSLVLAFSLKNYYYGVAEIALDNYSADEISASFSMYGVEDAESFKAAGRNFITSFQDKDSIAVWIIDGYGNIILTSSGFEIKGEVEMPDFNVALNEGNAKWTGKLPSGEKIMASSCCYNYPSGSPAGVVRLMISLEALDAQLIRIYILIAVVILFMFSLLFISSVLFIRSIVNPVKNIGDIAKRIAGGDLDARIEKYPYNDEIGELCTTINDMANTLEVSDKMKNDFISTVSHELRTPLTAIKGWGETLLQVGSTDPAMAERGMSVIISEASRLNDMVEELLDFSRMSSGRMNMQNARIDFLAELDEVVFAFKERAIRDGIEIIYNVPHNPAPANGDASRIKQVFINILDNALKYSSQGDKIIVFAQFLNPAVLVISISDTGAGIPPEALPHIKEKFYKANSTVRGSGIGLAVADEIVKHHNGEINIDSILGEGTTVTVTLPIQPTDKTSADEEGEIDDEQTE